MVKQYLCSAKFSREVPLRFAFSLFALQLYSLAEPLFGQLYVEYRSLSVFTKAANWLVCLFTIL